MDLNGALKVYDSIRVLTTKPIGLNDGITTSIREETSLLKLKILGTDAVTIGTTAITVQPSVNFDVGTNKLLFGASNTYTESDSSSYIRSFVAGTQRLNVNTTGVTAIGNVTVSTGDIKIDTTKRIYLNGATANVSIRESAGNLYLSNAGGDQFMISTGSISVVNLGLNLAYLDPPLLVSHATSNSIIKAWVRYNGTTATLLSSYNVASVSVAGTGDYRVNLSRAFTSTNQMCGVVTNHTLTLTDTVVCAMTTTSQISVYNTDATGTFIHTNFSLLVTGI